MSNEVINTCASQEMTESLVKLKGDMYYHYHVFLDTLLLLKDITVFARLRLSITSLPCMYVDRFVVRE